MTDPLTVALSVARAFRETGIHYLVGGSLASSIYGVYRLTKDVDLVAEIHRTQVDPLVAK